MRENKFRVYCEFEFEGRIEKSMESSASWFLLTQTGKLWTYGPGEIPRPLEKEYKKAIPLFYTGLKDKNGKEIYEGDIVLKRLKNTGMHFERKDVIEIPDCYTFTFVGHVGEFEIIGNIYENPELLKKKI